MDFFRTWILPPLIGAVIGYFTNWLAIKMLFRPLKPVMLGSWKLPFTPGILPRERERLSISIGETVSRELLTREVFAERLSDPFMIDKVETSVVVLLDGVLSMPVEESLAPLLKHEQAVSTEGEPELGRLALEISRKALSSLEFRTALSQALKSAAEEFLALPAETIVSRQVLEKAVHSLAHNCGKPEFRAKLETMVLGNLKSGSDKTAVVPSASQDPSQSSFSGTCQTPEQAPLFTEKQLTPLAVLASDILYAKLIPVAYSILGDSTIQNELELLAMKAVKGAINRLGPIQRLIVTAANYEKTLQNSMPETIEELSQAIIQLLGSQTMKEKLVKAIAGYISAMRFSGSESARIGTTTDGLGWAVQPESDFNSGKQEHGAGIQSNESLLQAVDQFLKEISNDAEGFSARLADRYERFSGRTISELLPVLSADLAEGLTRSIAAGISHPDSSELVSGVVRAFLIGFIKAEKGKSLKEVLSISQEDLVQIARSVTRTVLNALSAQSEQLLDALDIKSMVIDKINALDMADVERIILSVVHDELSWITFLGGVLGALIGLVQSLVSML